MSDDLWMALEFERRFSGVAGFQKVEPIFWSQMIVRFVHVATVTYHLKCVSGQKAIVHSALELIVVNHCAREWSWWKLLAYVNKRMFFNWMKRNEVLHGFLKILAEGKIRYTVPFWCRLLPPYDQGNIRESICCSGLAGGHLQAWLEGVFYWGAPLWFETKVNGPPIFINF